MSRLFNQFFESGDYYTQQAQRQAEINAAWEQHTIEQANNDNEPAPTFIAYGEVIDGDHYIILTHV